MDALRTRGSIPQEQTWNLEDIYPSPDAWEDDFQLLQSLYPRAAEFEGTLNTPSGVRKCFEFSDQIGLLTEKLYVYANLKHHEDTSDARFQAPVGRIERLSVEVSEALSFVEPELLTLPEAILHELINSSELAFYKFTLDRIIRRKPHTLPKEQEALLAKAGIMAQAPETIFEMLNNADMKFPSIKNEVGEDIEVTHGRYSQFLESRDRRVRNDAFNAMFGTYRKLSNTIASTLNANVQKNIFYTRALQYPSSLEMALFSDNIPTKVYTNLINTVHEKLPVFHRYLDLRKRTLGVDELHMYDLSVPLVSDFEWKISYEEAVETITEAFRPLGEPYLDIVKKAWRDRWIDVYENVGKRSGAYSWGVYRIHPYILLNHEDTLNHVFTIAHEMGHAVHSYLSHREQEYRYAHYTIFIAEIASTLNESLLMHHLLNRSDDNKKKAFLLTHYADNFRGTVFVQTLFAEFEKLMHEMAERGEPLTVDTLNAIYYRLHETYYGPGLVLDKDIEIGWMRIPHFYSSFYVYKYATGFSAANSFSRRILRDGTQAVDRYLSLLRSGGKDYPLNLLKAAGLDMATPEPISEALSVFEDVVKELETLI